jgi:hypothetical protein
MKQRKDCLYKFCPDLEYARGLCQRHYQIANLLVRSGRLSWDKLVSEGKALAKKPNRPKERKKTEEEWFLNDEVQRQGSS